MIRAAPDGYTIGLGSNSSLAYQPLEMKGLAWKSTNDYQSVAKLFDLPAILGVPADSPLQDLRRLHCGSEGESGKLKVSVSGLRSADDINMQHFNKLAGTAHRHGAVHRRRRRSACWRRSAAGSTAPRLCAGHEGPDRRRQAARARDFQQGKYDLLPDAKPIGETPWKETFRRLLRDRAERHAEADPRQAEGGVQGMVESDEIQGLPKPTATLGIPSSATT